VSRGRNRDQEIAEGWRGADTVALRNALDNAMLERFGAAFGGRMASELEPDKIAAGRPVPFQLGQPEAEGAESEDHAALRLRLRGVNSVVRNSVGSSSMPAFRAALSI